MASKWKTFLNLLPAVLFAAVVPAAAIKVLPASIINNYLVSIPLFIVYEILYGLIHFGIYMAIETWQRDFKDQSITSTSQRVSLFLWGKSFNKHYCKLIVNTHKFCDIRQLKIRGARDPLLKEIFVAPSISLSPAHRTSSNPVDLSQSFKGKYTLWEPTPSDESDSIWYHLKEAEQDNRILVLLGSPGSGKTTLAQYIALSLARPEKESPRLTSHTFPVLLFLRNHVDDIVRDPDLSLIEAVGKYAQQQWNWKPPAYWLDHHLSQGKCLILLDGLDQIADATERRLITEWIQRQFQQHGKNLFVLTSRPHGYQENQLNGIITLGINPFDINRIHSFMKLWYLANHIPRRRSKHATNMNERAEQEANKLLSRLQTPPALFSLAVNPLLLTMIAMLHSNGENNLPGRRVDLYDQICQVFLDKGYEDQDNRPMLTPDQKERLIQEVLQPLAFKLMEEKRTEVTGKEIDGYIQAALNNLPQRSETSFLESIKKESCVLLEKVPAPPVPGKKIDTYRFVHLTFQEYLAAAYFFTQDKEHDLLTNVKDGWWHETIRLFCAQKEDSTSVITTCLDDHPDSFEALKLAIDCYLEKIPMTPSTLTLLTSRLQTHELSEMVAQAKLDRRLQQMIPLQSGIWIDTSLITCIEYQIFLDEQRNKDLPVFYLQPDHWVDFSFPQTLADSPVLGVRQTDALAFCEWLAARDKQECIYRLPRLGEWRAQARMQWPLHREASYWTQSTEPAQIEWTHETPPPWFKGRSVSSLGSLFDRPPDPTSILRNASLLIKQLEGPFDQALRTSKMRRARALAAAIDNARRLNAALRLAFPAKRGIEQERNTRLKAASDIASELARELEPLLRFEYRDIYIKARDLAYMLHLLHERFTTNNFPIYEGILLVKERKRKTAE